MRRTRILARLPILLALALVLLVLGLQSSLLRLIAIDLAQPPAIFVVFAGILVALLPALFARGTPLPAAIGLTLPIVTLADYGENKLDWLRTLKNFGVQDAAGASLPRLLLALAALILLAALHATDFAVRLRARGIERGIPRAQATQVATASLVRGAAAIGFALGVTVVLGALVLYAAGFGETLQLGSASFLVPLLATALVAIGGFLLVRGLRGSSY
jgi:hypothetical protein